MYSYWLSQKDHYATDRAAANKVLERFPEVAEIARANRAFMTRAVRYLADQGITQFIDLGSGLPARPNVHEAARTVTPGARVVYVDRDPVVLAHARALLAVDDKVGVVAGDIRDPGSLFSRSAARTGVIDSDRPAGVLLISVLHFLTAAEADAAVATVREWMAPGSYLVISAGTSTGTDPELIRLLQEVYGDTAPVTGRTEAEIAAWFDGLTLVEPGLVDVWAWRPDTWRRPATARARFLAGVGRKDPGGASGHRDACRLTRSDCQRGRRPRRATSRSRPAKTSRDGPAASVNVRPGPATVGGMSQADWAETVARSLLEEPLPHRWAHSQGVAAQARTLAPILGRHADAVTAAAWLHDIGYAPACTTPASTRSTAPGICATFSTPTRCCAGWWPTIPAPVIEAAERGLAADLFREFRPAAAWLGRRADLLRHDHRPSGPAHDRSSSVWLRSATDTGQITWSPGPWPGQPPELAAAVARVARKLAGLLRCAAATVRRSRSGWGVLAEVGAGRGARRNAGRAAASTGPSDNCRPRRAAPSGPPRSRLLGRRLAADRAGGQNDGELLADLTVAGVEDHVPGIGVDAGDASDLAVDAGFFPGLADRRLGQRFAELDRAAGQRPVAVVGAADQQDLARVVDHDRVRRGDHAVRRRGVRVVVVVDPACHRRITPGPGPRLSQTRSKLSR